MKLGSRNKFQYIKDNFQFIYGVVLLIVIPGLLIVNTVIFVNSTQDVLDEELRRKAALAGSIFADQASSLITSKIPLQELVDHTVSDNEEIHSLDVFIPNGDDFEVIASLDQSIVGEITKYFYHTFAWRGTEPIAYSTNSPALSTIDEMQAGEERFWVVITPVFDIDGKKSALVSMKLSSEVIDNLSRNNVIQSIMVLTVSVIIIFLLLFNNTRLFHFATLFRKIKEVDEMKDEFISMTSHELRAPITGIRGYLQMILDGSFGTLPKEAEEKLKMVSEESDRLHDLVEDLLEVSRIEQNRIEMNIVSINIGDSINSVEKTFEKQISDKGLQLDLHLHDDLPNVSADESRIKQVLVNLISNAVKYTEKGTITVTAEFVSGKEDMVKVKVSDTGIGMSAKNRERLFEKFYRVQNEKTDKITGTGLGLWITKELVHLMGGEIYVDSIEGTGTQVTLMLKIINQDKKS